MPIGLLVSITVFIALILILLRSYKTGQLKQRFLERSREQCLRKVGRLKTDGITNPNDIFARIFKQVTTHKPYMMSAGKLGITTKDIQDLIRGAIQGGEDGTNN